MTTRSSKSAGKRSRKKPVAKKLVAQAQDKTPEWVDSMHSFFGQNGFYRADDLRRVLGDPRDQVDIGASRDLSLSFTTKR